MFKDAWSKFAGAVAPRWVAVFGGSLVVASVLNSGCESTPETSGSDIPGGAGAPAIKCDADADCSSGHCDSLQGCVECQLDQHCESGERCRGFACDVATSCSAREDCTNPATPACSAQTGFCEQCATHADCADTQRCTDESKCESVDLCKTSADCFEGVCDRDEGICVTCLADIDCGEGRVCESNTCLDACTMNDHCSGDRPVCDTVYGHCVSCLQDSDCEGDYHCLAGVCEPDVCEPGTSLCDLSANAVLRCSDSGASYSPLLCSNGTTCVDGTKGATCQTWVCSPGQTICDATQTRLQTCDTDGLSLISDLDCSEEGGRCEDLQCVDVECEAGKNFCSGGDSYLCGPLGTSSALAAPCGGNQFCDATDGLCKNHLCTPSATSCEGSIQKTCNADGSGYLDADVDCAEAGDACYSGSCQPIVCSFDLRCNGDVLERCAAEGTRITGTECTSSRHCKENGATASCVADVCVQGTSGCFSDVFGECNENGSGFESEVICADLGLSCLSSLGCYAELGTAFSSHYNFDQDHFLNQFQAVSDGKLSRISMYLRALATTNNLTWEVFEADSETGDFSLIASALTTPTSSFARWHESPDLDVELVASKYYLVGVYVVNTTYNYYGTAGVTSVGPLSFRGRFNSADTNPPETTVNVAALASTTQAYNQRLSFK